MEDNTVTRYTDDIARTLETALGVSTPLTAVDTELASRLQRISASLTAGAIQFRDDHDSLVILTDTDINNPVDGHILAWDPTTETWINKAISTVAVDIYLKDLADVDSSLSPSSNDILQYSGTEWVARTLAVAGVSEIGHVHSHGTLTDLLVNDHTQYVNAVAAAPLTLTGQTITFNYDTSDFGLSGNNLYVKDSGISLALNDLTDVTMLVAPDDRDIISFRSASNQWIKIPRSQFNHDELGQLLDDDHTQYLLHNGTRALTGNWAAGPYTVSNTWTTASSHDNIKTLLPVTVTSFDAGAVYRPVYVDIDYTASGAGAFGLGTIRAFHTDITTLTASGGSLAETTSGFSALISLRGQSAGALNTGTMGLNVSLATLDSTLPIYGAFTKAINAGTTVAYGYQGYGQNTSASTGLNAAGVFGYAVSTSGIESGLRGVAATTGTRGFSLTGVGHIHNTGGSAYFYTGTAITEVTAKTNIGTGDLGSVYIQKYLEVDDMAYFDGGITLADTKNIVLKTTTGTKIGTATAQKLGFWDAVPIIQPTTAGAAATFVANTSGIVDDTATFDGYTLGQVVRALRTAGLLA